MTIRVDVWSDFVCPWCFLASTSLARLQEIHDVEIIWRAYELRPKNGPPIDPQYQAYIEEVGRPRMIETARQHYGIEINSGPFGIDSRPALIGDKYAESQGLGAAYHDAVFRAYWQQARSIEDRTVLREIAESVGLDGAAFLKVLDSPELDMAVSADITQARLYGLTGVPAIVFNKKYLVSGAQPFDVLREVVERILTDESDQPAGV